MTGARAVRRRAAMVTGLALAAAAASPEPVEIVHAAPVSRRPSSSSGPRAGAAGTPPAWRVFEDAVVYDEVHALPYRFQP